MASGENGEICASCIQIALERLDTYEQSHEVVPVVPPPSQIKALLD
jgi:hypothetical protein